ncbi:hypothetical protein AgCh_035253 [Apium graveolens]
MITIQEPYLACKRLHFGVNLDDTNTNTWGSSVFAEDPVAVSLAPSCAKQSSQIDRFEDSTLEGSPIVNEPVIGESSQAHSSASSLQEEQGFEAIVHDSNLVKSPPIQLDVPIVGEQHTVITTVPTVSQTVAFVTDKDFNLSMDETLDNHQDKIRRLVKDKLDDLVPNQVEINNKFQKFIDQMARFDMTSMEQSIKNLKQSFMALHEVVQSHITSNNDTRVKLDQLHQSRYEPSALLMEGIKESARLLRSSAQTVQTQKAKSKETGQQVDVGMERLLKAAEGPSLSREFDELLKALRASLNNNFFTYKKTLDKSINFLRVILVTNDNFLEKRIVVNINDSSVDRYTGRYLKDVETKLPKIQINTKDDLDDDEQKKDDQKPSDSNPSQSTKATSSKVEDKKMDDKKRGDERRRKKKEDGEGTKKNVLPIQIQQNQTSKPASSNTQPTLTSKPKL